MPSPMFDFIDVNDHAPLLWNDDGIIHFFWGNPKLVGAYPFQWTSSEDNGATWSEVKFQQFKNKIAEVENIKVTDEDIDKYLQSIEDEKMRDMFSTNPEWKQRISGDLTEKKIVDFLIENQKVTEKIESVK